MLHAREFGKTLFERADPRDANMRQIELTQDIGRAIVHAQRQEREILREMHLERSIERKRPRQVIRVEQRAEKLRPHRIYPNRRCSISASCIMRRS
jgi:hypothetical protein